ncbi:MAG: VOC family protein [Nannocystales bacterium]
MNSRPPTLGLRHLALWVHGDAFDATLRFYTEGLGLGVDWHPDADNIYLSSGGDNVALHRAVAPREVSHKDSPLDHLGFAMASADDVRAWHAFLEPKASELGIELLNVPKLHRDGATSFYLRDPAGHQVQMLHVPSIRP